MCLEWSCTRSCLPYLIGLLYQHPHFRGKETEAHRTQGTCPKSHLLLAGPGYKLRPSWFPSTGEGGLPGISVGIIWVLTEKGGWGIEREGEGSREHKGRVEGRPKRLFPRNPGACQHPGLQGAPDVWMPQRAKSRDTLVAHEWVILMTQNVCSMIWLQSSPLSLINDK